MEEDGFDKEGTKPAGKVGEAVEEEGEPCEESLFLSPRDRRRDFIVRCGRGWEVEGEQREGGRRRWREGRKDREVVAC